MPSLRGPGGKFTTLTAKRGNFKRAVSRIPSEVDFFGRRWQQATDQLIGAMQALQVDVQVLWRRIVEEVARRIIARTPVDTGFAKRSWTITEREDGDGSFDLVIENGAHYIVYLEYGWSRQAPQGMIRVTLIEMAQEFEAKARRIGT